MLYIYITKPSKYLSFESIKGGKIWMKKVKGLPIGNSRLLLFKDYYLSCPLKGTMLLHILIVKTS